MITVFNIIEEGRLGGPQLRILRVANRLKQLGVKTVVICPKYKSEVFTKLLKENDISYIAKSLHRLTKDYIHLTKYFLLFPFEVFNLVREMKKKPDSIIHISGGAWQWKGVIAGIIGGKKIVWHLNDTHIPIYLVPIFSFLSRFVSHYIFAGESVKKIYSSRIKANNYKSEVIPAPVDIDTFQFHTKKIPPAGEFLKIITIANIVPVKGLELVLDIAKLVVQENLPIEFQIAGKVHENQKKYFDQLTESLKKSGAQKHVSFLGFQDEEKIEELIADSHIYLCTSHFEASPLAVWEAMAKGSPIVSSKVGDIPIICEDGKNGFLLEGRDPKNYLIALKNYLQNPEMILTHGKESRHKIEKSCSLEIVASLHKKIYSLAVGNE